MKKTNKEIISQIKTLLDELENNPAEISKSHKTISVKKVAPKPVGCIGAIQSLIDDKFFDVQKSVAQVVDKLKEEGQPYSRELVSMNLLNLVKPPRRVLRRIEDKENKQWHYIVRR
jgi:hypothetical protein